MMDEDVGFGFGVFEARGAELPLERIDLHARVRGMHACVTIEQTFRNRLRERLEVSYVFPAPALGAITGYTFVVDGVATRGELCERDAARARYDEAIANGQAASTLEEDRPEVLTVRVGNLAPGSVARIRIDLDLVLPTADDTAVLRLPLLVGARYVPGAPLAGPQVGTGTAADTVDAPDASRVSPPAIDDPGVRVGVLVDVEAETVTASHPIAIEREGRRSRIRLRDVVPDRDVVLRFPLVAREEALFVPDLDGDGGTLVATVCADPSVAAPPLDIALVIDRSGSMDGAKIVAARRAARTIVESLTPGDRFTLLAFDDRLDAPLGVELVPATAARRRLACDVLDQLTARGGTELAQPLDLAAQATDERSDRRRVILLITDGQVANEDQLVALVEKRRAATVMSLAIGPAANQGLCQRLAARTSGSYEAAPADADLPQAIERTLRRLLSPLLEDLELAVTGARLEPASRAPERPPSLVAGVPAVLTARVRGTPTAVALHAVDGGRPVQRSIPLATADLPALRRVWARLRVRDLEDALVCARFPAGIALEDELLATSLGSGVMSRYTAFVAVDPRRRSMAMPLRSIAQPVIATGADDGRLSRTMTRAGTLRGKLHYLSPELVLGKPTTPASDVFVLAVLLAELATTRRLFTADSDYEMLLELRDGVGQLVLPPHLAMFGPLLLAALAKDPADRPRDGEELHRALAALGLARAPVPLREAVGQPRGPLPGRIAALWIVDRIGIGESTEHFEAVYAGPPAHALPDAVVHAQLGDEAPDLLPIDSPYIARYLGAIARPRRAHVVERVFGPTIHELCRTLARDKATLSAAELSGIALDASAALAAIHAAGHRHRELDGHAFVVTAERTQLVRLPDAPRGTALPPLPIPLRGLRPQDA